MGDRLTEDFFHLFVEKNSNGTKNLRLKGRELDLRIGQRLTAQDMEHVAWFLKENPIITRLDLSYNNFGDQGFDILVNDYLGQENDLEYLNIMGCNLTHTAMATLTSAFSTLRLKTLRLAGNKLGAESGRFLAELLDFTDCVEYLDLGDTDQTIFSMCGIMSRLTYSSVKVLNISRVIPTNMYAQTNSSELCIVMAQVLEYNERLVELHMQKCELDGHDVQLLLEGLVMNDTLEFLDLGFNKFGDHGMELLAKWLRERPNLIAINVAGNAIHDNGARILSLCMPSSRIRFLDISQNKITDKGLTSILHTIKKPYQMRILYIWGNLFGAPTNKILQRMLLSKVLVQEYIDVKIYVVDNVPYAAYYGTNHYKHKYYDVMDHGCAPELKIIKNYIPPDNAVPRALLDLKHIDRFPPVNKVLTDEINKPATSHSDEIDENETEKERYRPPEFYIFIGDSDYSTDVRENNELQ